MKSPSKEADSNRFKAIKDKLTDEEYRLIASKIPKSYIPPTLMEQKFINNPILRYPIEKISSLLHLGLSYSLTFQYFIPLFLTLIVFSWIPLAASEFWMIFMINIGILAIFAMSFNIVFFYAGYIPVGHPLYFGFSGYITALLNHHFQVPLVLAFFCGPIFSFFLASLIASFCLKLNSIYYSIVSLIIAQIGYLLALNFYEITGGENGMTGFVEKSSILSHSLFRYYFLFILVLVGFHLVWVFTRSPFFLLLKASRENQYRAQFSGLNLTAHRVLALGISGFFAGLAGSLSAIHLDAVTPHQMGLEPVFDIIVVVLLGGVSFYWGPILGAITVALTTHYFSIQWPILWPLAIGLSIIGLVLYKPEGIAGLFHRYIFKWLRR